jgi:uncharacterized membrane protein
MDQGLSVLLAVTTALIAGHLLLSHRWRAPVIGALGLGWFQFVYSALSIICLLGVLLAYHQAPHEPVLWSSDNPELQLVYALGSCFASALLIASLFGNPALIGANIVDLSTRPPGGVFVITRHPMMFGIAIWSLLQILVTPTARNLIAFSGIALLAVVGSRLQDRKKIAQSGREWKMWSNRTPFWPDLRNMGKLGPVWLFGILLSLVVTWFQMHTVLSPLGLWYFVPQPL